MYLALEKAKQMAAQGQAKDENGNGESVKIEKETEREEPKRQIFKENY